MRLASERPDIFLASVEGIRDVQSIQNTGGVVSTWGDSGRQQLDTIVSQHFNPRRQQTNLEALLNALGNSNLGNPSPDDRHYIVTDKDMYAGGTSFVFGVTRASQGLAVQSLARFMNAIPNRLDQATMARHIARHEYGHMIGMNNREDYDNPDMRGGLYEGHCANTCTIKQVVSVAESVRLVKDLDFLTDAGFCGSCVKKIRNKV